MAKQKSWFRWVKRLFTSDPNHKKTKKWGWGLVRLKKKRYPAITAAIRTTTLTEATAEQRKHALTVAVATAAAAEAAVSAARAAAEVVKLTSGSSRSCLYLSKGDRSLAAIKIQSAYRAHLARKALRALKGVTRLQALIRGQAVRRQVSRTLKNLPYDARKRVEILETNSHTAEESNKNDQIKQYPKQNKFAEKEFKVQPECNHSLRTWDCSIHSREDIEAIWLRKQEAAVKRERMKRYSFSQRERKIPQMVEESVYNKDYGRESCRTLGRWLNKESCCDWDVLHEQDIPPNSTATRKGLQEEGGLNSQVSIPRKSFSHVKRISSVGAENSLQISPVFPTYMAVTESSKAKARSVSTPRLRTGFFDTCSNLSEPHNNEDISFYSYYGEGSQQKCHNTKNYFHR